MDNRRGLRLEASVGISGVEGETGTMRRDSLPLMPFLFRTASSPSCCLANFDGCYRGRFRCVCRVSLMVIRVLDMGWDPG